MKVLRGDFNKTETGSYTKFPYTLGDKSGKLILITGLCGAEHEGDLVVGMQPKYIWICQNNEDISGLGFININGLWFNVKYLMNGDMTRNETNCCSLP